MRILAFSKYLAYDVGGAEKSTLRILSGLSKSEVTVCSVAGARFLGQNCVPVEIPSPFLGIQIKKITQLRKFYLIEYWLNRARIIKKFTEFDQDELWTFGVFAPAAILGFKGRKVYFVRSETDLAIFRFYGPWYLKLVKILYFIVQAPFFFVYRHDVKNAIGCSKVICNSDFMAQLTSKKYGVVAEIRYPDVEVESIKKETAAFDVVKNRVLFIGDSSVKGIDIVLGLAKICPSLEFQIVSRKVTRKVKYSNVLWTPWGGALSELYGRANVIVVPSQWLEAYGRVAREAYLLGKNVLVSNCGGLPEAVNYDSSCLVDDYKNLRSWKRHLCKLLNCTD